MADKKNTKSKVQQLPEHIKSELNALIREKGVNVLPVVDEGGRLLGEVTRRDILNAVAKICCASS